MPDLTRLSDALAAEHAAIFAYGLVGARLPGRAGAGAARAAEEAHRSRRDALVLALSERGAAAPAAEPSYQLPFEVTEPDAARRLAVLVEERVGAIWRAALPELSGADRRQALDALVDTALRATGWRSAAGIRPATVAFPGVPA